MSTAPKVITIESGSSFDWVGTTESTPSTPSNPPSPTTHRKAPVDYFSVAKSYIWDEYIMERIEGKTFTHNSTQYYDYTIKCKCCSYQTTLAKKIVSSGDLNKHTRNKHGITFNNNERQIMEGKCRKPRKRKTSKTTPPTINTTITTPVGPLTEAERKKLKREREADLLRRILALKDFLSLKSVPKHCWKNKYLIDAFEEDISDYSDDMSK